MSMTENDFRIVECWLREAMEFGEDVHNAPYEKAIAALEEFKTLKDAEEQGLLLRLPCKVGDTAWVIDEDNEYPGKKKIYEAKWKRVTFVQVSANHSFELRGEVGYQVYDWFCNDGRTMPYGMYVGQTHTKVGEVVFLTKEEAEQALAEMKGV